VNYRGDWSECGGSFDQLSDGVAIGDVTDDGLALDVEVLQLGHPSVQAILPDVGDDDEVIPPDDLRRRKPDAAGTAGNDRNLSHLSPILFDRERQTLPPSAPRPKKHEHADG
jgi:hypothetical protein